MIRQSNSLSWSGTSPFSVPCVPTGINTGVSTVACGSFIRLALAFVVEHSANILNERACVLCIAIFWKSPFMANHNGFFKAIRAHCLHLFNSSQWHCLLQTISVFSQAQQPFPVQWMRLTKCRPQARIMLMRLRCGGQYH